MPPDSGAGNPHYWRGGLARGSSHPCTLRAGANQALDGLQRASPAIEGGSGSGSGNNLLEPALSSRSQGVRISPSKPAQEPTPRANKTDVSKSTTSDLTASHVSQTEAEPPLRQFPTGPLSSGGATSSHGGKSSRDVDGITSVGCGPREGSIETSVAINFKDKESGRSVRHETTPEASAATNKEVDRDADAGRARHILTQQGRRAEQYSSGNFKGLPPDAEVFEARSERCVHCTTVVGRLLLNVPSGRSFKVCRDPSLFGQAAAVTIPPFPGITIVHGQLTRQFCRRMSY